MENFKAIIKKILRWGLAAAYAGFIFYLSSRTWSGASLFPYSDKVMHLLLYLGLGGLVFWALRTTRLKGHRHIGGIALLLAGVYGLSDEIHQLFVAGREFSLMDLAADVVGAMLGIFIASTLAAKIRKEGIT